MYLGIDIGTSAVKGVLVDERDREFIVAPEIVAQADEHRALEHVGVAVGTPGVANAVGAGADDDAGVAAACAVNGWTARKNPSVHRPWPAPCEALPSTPYCQPLRVRLKRLILVRR